MGLSRHELRYKVMTILYQVNLYDNNNIEYNIDETTLAKYYRNVFSADTTSSDVTNSIVILRKILSMDFSRKEEEINKLNQTDAEYIHLDVMDGKFVPNSTFNHELIKNINKDYIFDTILGYSVNGYNYSLNAKELIALIADQLRLKYISL